MGKSRNIALISMINLTIALTHMGAAFGSKVLLVVKVGICYGNTHRLFLITNYVIIMNSGE